MNVMSKVKVSIEEKFIPTYKTKEANDMPMFFENRPYQGASGKIYPIPYCDGITDEKIEKKYQVYTLENEYIRTEILPELGGKILRGFDKESNYDFIYHNEVVKPALVGLAGPWISGGIEFNWPQHHRPTTFMPLEAITEEKEDGSATVWTGEVEPLNRMKGMTGITLDEGRSYIKAKVKVYNRTCQPQVFMWWANLAVPVNEQYRTVFPPDVEWVNDHDRRAVLEWPIAKGLYQTARPYDFTTGTDISYYSAIKVPSSYLVSQGQSDMDFLSGYDEGLRKGVVTVADHQIAPGKKMWHWGTGNFGDMWCSNLTDTNGPYIELMTGVYTDNQPDFTWIAPYESREFEQYWYPVRDIGQVKNATIDAAMNMEIRGEELYFGFQVTGCFPNAVVTVREKDRVVYTETVSLDPSITYVKSIPLGDMDFENLTVSLVEECGRELVSYTPYRRGGKKPIEPRKPVKRPSEIENSEELYLNGLHLEQYKQHNYCAADYYIEGLKRDEYDSRCNSAMARLSLRSGDFKACIAYADKAISRLTIRNQHPTDTQAFYLKGVALKFLGRYKEAADELSKAGWNYATRSAAYFELAELDCRAGEYEAALEKLEVSIRLNQGHTRGLDLKAVILRLQGRQQEAKALLFETLKNDPLDFFAMVELSHYGETVSGVEQFLKKPENIIDVVSSYMGAGLYHEAAELSLSYYQGYPLLYYYGAYCLSRIGKGEEAANARKSAQSLDTGYCFPSRLTDILVLEDAIREDSTATNAHYYLGSLLYDKERYQEAKEHLEVCVSKEPEHYKAQRTLSLLYFDKFDESEKAIKAMEAALQVNTENARLLFEYQQLLKNTNHTVEERLRVYQKYPNMLAQRDDCYLDEIILTAMQGYYQQAIDMAKKRHFHIYEGGEGRLTNLHAWIHVLRGNELAEQGKYSEAVETYKNGTVIPKSYGEAKTYFNQEAHLYYYMGRLYEEQGMNEPATDAYVKAGEYKAAVSEISLFRALALEKTGEMNEADAVLKEMLEQADDLLENCDRRSYYGVGSPSPMPFEYDIRKKNTVDGSILKAFALLGYKKMEEARSLIEIARQMDATEFRIYVFDQIVARV